MKNNKIHILGAVLSVLGLAGAAFPKLLSYYFIMFYVSPISMTVLAIGSTLMLWGSRKSEPMRFWFVLTAVFVVFVDFAVLALYHLQIGLPRRFFFVTHEITTLFTIVLFIVAILGLAVNRKISRDDLPWFATIAALFIVKWLPTYMHIANLFVYQRFKYAIWRREGDTILWSVIDIVTVILLTLPLIQTVGRRIRNKMPVVLSILGLVALVVWDVLLKIEPHSEYETLLHIRVLMEQIYAPCLAFAAITMLVALITPLRRRCLDKRLLIWATIIALAVSAYDLARFMRTNVPFMEYFVAMPFALTATLYYAAGILPKKLTKGWTSCLVGVCALALAIGECKLIKPFNPVPVKCEEYEDETIPEISQAEKLKITMLADSVMSDIMVHNSAESGLILLADIRTGELIVDRLWQLDSANTPTFVSDNDAKWNPQIPGGLFRPILLAAMLEDRSSTVDMDTKCNVKWVRLGTETREDAHNLFGQPDSSTLAESIINRSNIGLCDIACRNYANRREDLLNRVKRTVLPFESGEQVGFDLGCDKSFLNFCMGYEMEMAPLEILAFYNGIANGGVSKTNGEEYRVCSETTAETIFALMRDYAENAGGDADSLQDMQCAYYQVTVRISDNYSQYVIGAFPDESPRYTCMIMLFNTGSPLRPIRLGYYMQQIANSIVE